MEINKYSVEWMDFTKNEQLICQQVKEATTAFAERRSLARRTTVLKSKAYTHEMLCREGLARYFCNGQECASWDGEILTVAWGASYYCRVDQFLHRIRWKCIDPAYARAKETGLPWPSWEKKEYNAFEIKMKHVPHRSQRIAGASDLPRSHCLQPPATRVPAGQSAHASRSHNPSLIKPFLQASRRYFRSVFRSIPVARVIALIE